MKSLTIIIIFLIVIVPAQTPEAGYRGIIPIKSTRADVERILGRSKTPDNPIYYLRDEIVIIDYSKYGCVQPPTEEGWPIPPIEGWNVPPNTVLAVRINLRRQVPVESLKLDLTTFKKKRGDSDVPSHFYYVDNEQGLVLDLNGNPTQDIVSSLVYHPAAKYKHLRCPQEVVPSSE